MSNETQLAVVDGGQHGTDIEMAPQQSIIGTMRQLVPQTIAEAAVLARAFHRAGMFGLRSEDQALTLIMTGMELGLAPATAVRGIHVIEGKPSLSADLMVALCKARRDVCLYFTVVESTNDVATCRTHRRGDPGPVTQSFTMDDAKRAGLIDKANASREPKKSPWNAYPGKMLAARCKSALARAVYEDLVMGLYTPDELTAGEAYDYVQAEVDAARDEAPRDVETVTLRHAIAAYLECLPTGPQEKAFEAIRKAAKLETFSIADLDHWPVENLRTLQANIAKWQAVKPIDNAAPSPPADQAPAPEPQQATTTADAVIIPSVPTTEEQAAILKTEAAEAQASNEPEEDPFADN